MEYTGPTQDTETPGTPTILEETHPQSKAVSPVWRWRPCVSTNGQRAISTNGYLVLEADATQPLFSAACMMLTDGTGRVCESAVTAFILLCINAKVRPALGAMDFQPCLILCVMHEDDGPPVGMVSVVRARHGYGQRCFGWRLFTAVDVKLAVR
jgi:hypothetical protein